MLRGLAALLLVVPLLAQAAGLGPLRVLSALGQPLSAEIEITSLRPGEEDGLSAKLGSEQAFRQAGIAFNPALFSLRFSIARSDGKAVIRLSSPNPVNEPFLELLVELQWATGRLVREYTFLLDPPEYRTPRAAREDDRAARERALKESESRITDLEKNVADLQKLLEIKNQQVAELEKRASGKPAAAMPAKPATEAPKPATAKPEPAKPEPAKVAAVKPEASKPEAAKPEPGKPEPMKPETTKPEPAKPEATAADAPKPEAAKPAAPVVKPAAVKPKPRPAPPPPPPPPSLVDEFLENPVALGGLGAVLVLLGGYGAWAWRRKKAGQSKMQDSLLGASTGGGAASVFNAPAATADEAPSVSDLPVSETSVGGAEADEVDPIAEADVYMAYGRDAQAEEILREALLKDAARPGVLAKLLEIYAGRRDTKNFEQTALKLKGLVGGDGDEWAKAAALGASIDPDNGLYSGADAASAPEPATAATPAAPSLDFDLDAAPAGGDAATQAGGTDMDLDSGVAPQDEPSPSIDFDLGSDSAADAEPKPSSSADVTAVMDLKAGADGSGLDFDLGDAAPAAKSDSEDGNSIDFDLNLDVDNAGTPGKGGGREIDPDATVAVSSMDLSSISLDLDTPAGGGGESDPKWQEVATKLDLAKAYEEMGDKDGARELLNEVLKEGDDAQQGQAKQMLAGLD